VTVGGGLLDHFDRAIRAGDVVTLEAISAEIPLMVALPMPFVPAEVIVRERGRADS
jgi:hypothetical protein